MAKVRIVYVPTPDLRGPDLDRIGTIEEVDDDLARGMLAEGSAVPVDDEAPPAVAEHAQPTYALPAVFEPAATMAEDHVTVVADETPNNE